MKVAFHFNAGFPGLGNPYGPPIERLIFSKILAERRVRLASKIFIGDLPLYLVSSDAVLFERTLKRWRVQALNGWRRFTVRMENLAQTDTFVVCFESIGSEFAVNLHKLLSSEECYLGAIQVDDASEIHWELYSDALPLRYRISDRVVAVLYDETQGDVISTEEKEEDSRRLLSAFFGFIVRLHSWVQAQ